MNPRAVRRFFKALDAAYPGSCTIYLTGAGAGLLYGRIRATMDLDFAVTLGAPGARQGKAKWQVFADSVRQVTLRTGIAVQYAEDIDRWSAITYMGYRRTARHYAKLGKITVKVLDPSHWAIGKLARYLEPDVRDLIEVLRRTRTRAVPLAMFLGRALRRSPKSTACELFRRHVEHFLETYGRRIWGRTYDAAAGVRRFRRSAGIRLP